MNLRNLNKVFERYIEKFEWLNQKPEPNESYKWAAVKNFQTALDLNATDADFPDMLYRAWKATENLTDSNQQQPFYALYEYAKREPQTVRTMFSDLFATDGGDLEKRQKKISTFLARADELLQKYFPDSHRYVNTQRSAMAYLWFFDPNQYYYYKATEAKYLADCVEFYDDWGTYNDFHLDVYHRFCDEIIAQMKNCPALMSAHKSRFAGCEATMHPDEQLHILLVDMIFCAKHYGLYDGIPIKEVGAPERRLYQERKIKAAELLKNVEAAEKDADMMEEASHIFADLLKSGAEITHRDKTLGTAELLELSNDRCTLYFSAKNERKEFQFLLAMANGFLKIAVPEYEILLEKYRPVMKREGSIFRQLEYARKALRPYEEYLD